MDSTIHQRLSSLASKHPELFNSGFAHVANVGKLHEDAPYDFCDGLQIRKATPNEASTLRELLAITRPLPQMMPHRNPYETSLGSIEESPATTRYLTTDLPEDQWRYHVIAFQGSNTTLSEFVEASTLTRARLHLGNSVIASTALPMSGLAFGTPSSIRRWDDQRPTDEHLLTLGLVELDDLRLVYEKMGTLKDDRAGLRDAIKRIIQLDGIPEHSPLRFLGFVSVLESLITHAPDPKDPYDSLTRQVSQKMLLIGRRSVLPIPYEIFDAGVEKEKLWKKLYAYRSAIAHGATPDFSGNLRCLKDPATALKFISFATVTLMRQALEEPALVADLRGC